MRSRIYHIGQRNYEKSITTFTPEAHEEDLSARQEEMVQLLDGLNDERDKLEDQPNMTQVTLRAPEDCPDPSSYLNDVLIVR